MKIGVLVGGGDAPGLNAAIKAVVAKASEYGFDVIGIKRGWAGLLEADYTPLSLEDVEEIHSQGGVVLHTSRTNPFKVDGGSQCVLRNLKILGINALIVMGGEDTLGVAEKFFRKGVPLVGVPKTIDNDLSSTDFTIGFDTAVSIATEAIDKLRTTAESHHRVIIVEVMGRYTGWIALYAGLAGGAHLILIPESPLNLEKIYSFLKERHINGKVYSIIVVAEGARPREDGLDVVQKDPVDEFGHPRLGGVSRILEGLIQKNTGLEARSVVLGHLQRGGPPTAFDRVLAMRLGMKAVDLIKLEEYGNMTSFRGNEITSVPLEEATKKRKVVSQELYEITQTFLR